MKTRIEELFQGSKSLKEELKTVKQDEIEQVTDWKNECGEVTLILQGNSTKYYGFVMSGEIRGTEGRNKGKYRKYEGFEKEDGGKMQSGRKKSGKLLRSIGTIILYDLESNKDENG